MNVCERLRHVKIREEEYEVPCGSRYCPACGQRWMGDMRVQAVAAIEHVGGDVGLLTITGPGDDYFARLCRARGWSRKDAKRWWNATARTRYRLMMAEATGAARRADRKEGGRWRVLYRVWEYQKRGVLHAHIVVPMRTERDRTTSLAVLRRLVEVAEFWAFGFVLGGDADEAPRRFRVPRLARVAAERAARYVAKYVTSTGAGKDSMVGTVQRTAQRGSVLYISRTLTERSGATMTTLRARRRIYARYEWARDTETGWRVACFVDSVQRGRAPLSRQAVRALRAFCGAQPPQTWVDPEDGEERAPTRAPVPLAAKPAEQPDDVPARRAVVVLAPVLLRDSRAPWLGPWRTAAEPREA